MKNIITTSFIILLFSLVANGQNKVKRYCEIYFHYDAFPGKTHKSSINIDYGQTETYQPFKDSLIVKKFLFLEQLKTLVSVLNYMSDFGWKYEDNIHLQDGVRMIFSREFMPSELNPSIERETYH